MNVADQGSFRMIGWFDWLVGFNAASRTTLFLEADLNGRNIVAMMAQAFYFHFTADSNQDFPPNPLCCRPVPHSDPPS